MANTSANKQLELLTVTCLVVGGMIGSGIFTLPSSLAQFGGISLMGWIIAAAGALVLARMFGQLSKVIPKTGGAYPYSREAFGEFTGFIVAWGYWLSVWSTNAAIALTFTGYLSIFIPSVGEGFNTALTSIGVIWVLTVINSRSIFLGGKTQVLTTVLKIIPILVVAIAGIFFFNPAYFSPFNLSQASSIQAITTASAMCLFAFMGLEAASVPAANIKNPETTISKATMMGTWIVVIIYIFSTISLFGILPPSEVQSSLAPFSDAAQKMFGNGAEYFIAAGACISTFGGLNTWILVQGQMPMALAQDQLLPKVFAKKNRNDTPSLSIIISSMFITCLLLFNQSKSFSNLYSFMILLTAVTVLVSYLATALVYTYFCIKGKMGFQLNLKTGLFSVIGIGFSIWMIIGSGVEAILWGGVGLLLGVPIYIWKKRTQ